MIDSKTLEYICCTLTTAYGEAVGGSDGTAIGRARGTIQIDRKTADVEKSIFTTTSLSESI
ncbi:MULTISPECIES: hypothetical protein [unclassified Tolypothrix]|uniref:hypothetical protein n=1 Tax=unclassified Tolypothrix TaxID=2649714 RepID=UPI0005EAB495|nr:MULTISPECIES: hypothetical protein [unclassified Tolypothrix]EKE96408.1 hypothetical protein FDUTEX481_09754 [Tolypothrix sp. PCC 7601]MBE9084155.1 hypothetical protein [Tolypothrix sp. LEGE 11397]UYD31053.1 hypothetical protein HGR01_39930 [Tolypothrix sp. PCC 7712]BAY96030.1 hypothetical protein NIES3275_81070 [Microchaete diplosiphon NIES-3275]